MYSGKKAQHDFPKMRGGDQRPFGTFPKIHPFWRRRLSLKQTFFGDTLIRNLGSWVYFAYLTSNRNMVHATVQHSLLKDCRLKTHTKLGTSTIIERSLLCHGSIETFGYRYIKRKRRRKKFSMTGVVNLHPALSLKAASSKVNWPQQVGKSGESL